MYRAIATIALMLAATAAHAQPLLSFQQARARAIQILKGDPYGVTTIQVSRHLKGQVLVMNGKDATCGINLKARPAWRLRVEVPKAESHDEIKGGLLIDARTGKMLCAGLPFLD